MQEPTIMTFHEMLLFLVGFAKHYIFTITNYFSIIHYTLLIIHYKSLIP